MIRLLIVDDHDVVRMGLKQVFSGRVDMEVAGEARTGEEAIAQVRSTPFDVALVDLSLSDMSGVDVLNRMVCNRLTRSVRRDTLAESLVRNEYG
jgi:DNA-binding NarL/FixJ family response regulator